MLSSVKRICINEKKTARNTSHSASIAGSESNQNESLKTNPDADNLPSSSDSVDVQQLISKLSVEELCQSANEYFCNIPDAMGLVAKPLRDPQETPSHLVRFCQLIQGLALRKNMTVMDFGCGPGWTARMLTQLGCKVILVDVSSEALKIAESCYHHLPPYGKMPQPRFLKFDGRKLDIPDNSIDRVFCFDAFHHVPNQSDILAEMSRVLVPGGIAGFSEPGPEHSQGAEAQHEMLKYRVVENDICIEDIWANAQKEGFDDLRLAVYSVSPFHLNLSEFNDFLRNGSTLDKYAQNVRDYMQGCRLFFLFKASDFPDGDSRSNPEGLKCQLSVTLDTGSYPVTGIANAHNSGTAAWRIKQDGQIGQVRLGCHLFDVDGRLIDNDFFHLDIKTSESSSHVLPGEEVCVPFTLPSLPLGVTGACSLLFDLVSENVCWFSDVPGGAPPIANDLSLACLSGNE